jgi:hypothetical protein
MLDNKEYKELINLFFIFNKIPQYLLIKNNITQNSLDAINDYVLEIKVDDEILNGYQTVVENRYAFKMKKEIIVKLLKLNPKTLIVMHNCSIRDSATRDCVTNDVYKMLTGLNHPLFGHELSDEEHRTLNEIVKLQINHLELAE